MYIYTYIHIYLFLEKENLFVAFIFTEQLEHDIVHAAIFELHIGKIKSQWVRFTKC